jgi:hypothetical protein
VVVIQAAATLEADTRAVDTLEADTRAVDILEADTRAADTRAVDIRAVDIRAVDILLGDRGIHIQGGIMVGVGITTGTRDGGMLESFFQFGFGSMYRLDTGNVQLLTRQCSPSQEPVLIKIKLLTAHCMPAAEPIISSLDVTFPKVIAKRDNFGSRLL